MATWPPTRIVRHDGWFVGLSDGYTKRANSVYPLGDGERPLEARLRFCEDQYGRRGLPCSFKLTSASLPSDLDHTLAEEGYDLVDRSSVQTRDIGLRDWRIDRRISFTDRPHQDWIRAYQDSAGYDDPTAERLAALLRRITSPSLYAMLESDGQRCAFGIGVRQDSLLTFYTIRVNRTSRGNGFGRAIMESLLAWGQRTGAREAVLQVMKDNRAAVGLYGSLGFQEVYSYWYRRKTVSSQTRESP
jgi:ribosomal protein S18 acetylase RimI-like enzyme